MFSNQACAEASSPTSTMIESWMMLTIRTDAGILPKAFSKSSREYMRNLLCVNGKCVNPFARLCGSLLPAALARLSGLDQMSASVLGEPVLVESAIRSESYGLVAQWTNACRFFHLSLLALSVESRTERPMSGHTLIVRCVPSSN